LAALVCAWSPRTTTFWARRRPRVESADDLFREGSSGFRRPAPARFKIVKRLRAGDGAPRRRVFLGGDAAGVIKPPATAAV